MKTEKTKVMLLHLPLKVKWYEMQESGEKTEEYREITPYWFKRLYQRKEQYMVGTSLRRTLTDSEAYMCCAPIRRKILKVGYTDLELKPYTHVVFRYGYTKRCFIHRIDSITIGKGKPEWGAPTERDVFIIRHSKEQNETDTII